MGVFDSAWARDLFTDEPYARNLLHGRLETLYIWLGWCSEKGAKRLDVFANNYRIHSTRSRKRQGGRR